MQVRHNGLERRVEHRTLGEVGLVGPAVRFSQSHNDNDNDNDNDKVQPESQ